MMDFFKALEDLKPALEELRQFRSEVTQLRQDIQAARFDLAKMTLEIEARMKYLSPILENIAQRQTEIELNLMGINARVGIT
jgi:chromosome segregation ATPase